MGHTMISGAILPAEQMRQVMSQCLARIAYAGRHIERDGIQKCPDCRPQDCRAASAADIPCTCGKS